MKVVTMVLGMVQTNCYLVYNEQTMEGFVVDPADHASRIEEKCSQLGIALKAILLTHGHYDHMLAAADIRETYQIPVYILRQEEELLGNSEYNLSASWAMAYSMKADVLVEDGEKLEIAGYSVEVLATPGHTSGSCCYYIASEKVLFSGDTLFCESLGRTDFPTSSTRDIIHSICKKLLPLPEDVEVYPGHNEATTIGNERKYNPVAHYFEG